MAGFLADATATSDLVGACARAGVNLVEIRRHRASDPQFDLEMATVDQCLRLAALGAVQAKAASGDLKAIRALTDGTLDLLADEPEGIEILPIDHPRLVALVLEIRAEEWARDPRSVHLACCPKCDQILRLRTTLDVAGVVTLTLLESFTRPESLRPGGPRGKEEQP